MVGPKNVVGSYMEILPGVFDKVPDEVYHGSTGYSRTNICNVADVSISYMLMKMNHQEESDAMTQGSMTHDLILFPEQFKEKYLVGPTVSRSTKKWKEFKKEYPDKTVVTSSMSDKVFQMRDALYKDPSIRSILENKNSMKEVSIWYETEGGILLKCRPDIILDGVIFDLKTSIAPHKEAMRYSAFKYGYDVQSVMYPDLCAKIGMTITDFIFLVVGSNPPHLTARYSFGEELRESGWDKYNRGVSEIYRYEKTNDKWDGLPYGREVVTL